MADPHVLTALRRKYAEIAGEIRGCHARESALESDLAVVGATILLFRADENLEAIFPVRPRPEVGWTSGGVWARTALDILRTAGRPLTMREIAEGVMDACNIPNDDGRALKAVQCALYEPIRRRVGDVLTLHPGKPMRWSVARG
jgi:hypothetical protein